MTERNDESVIRVLPVAGVSGLGYVAFFFSIFTFAAALIATVIGLVAFLAIGWITPVLAFAFLLALMLLMSIPIIGRWLRPVATGLVTVIGDATIWTRAPVGSRDARCRA